MTLAGAPFELYSPLTMTPIVVSVPHAGLCIPDEARLSLAGDEELLRQDADLFVDRLWHRAPQLGAALLVARVSRCVLDLNRAPDDIDVQVCAPMARLGQESPRGLVWRVATSGEPLLTAPLPAQELNRRIEAIHTPYHAALMALLEERRARFGFAVLIDGHSMPSVGPSRRSAVARRRADVVPGDVGGRSCAPALSAAVAEHFRAEGLEVVCNDPYLGGYITRRHGRPAAGVHAIQIEVNRDLYLCEEKNEYLDERAGKLEARCASLLMRLADLSL